MTLFFQYLFCISCNNKPIEPDNNDSLTLEYFPLNEGNIWEFKVERTWSIHRPPYRKMFFKGEERWEIKKVNWKDSTMIFESTVSVGEDFQIQHTSKMDSIIIDVSRDRRMGEFVLKRGLGLSRLAISTDSIVGITIINYKLVNGKPAN